MKYNIFQGNKQLENTVARSLGFEENQKNGYFTKNMFFETYFYLSKRFGEAKILDDCKDAGSWDFEVKDYTIRVHLNSSWVIFVVFGEYRLENGFTHCPYWVKIARERLKKDSLLIPLVPVLPEDKKDIFNKALEKFCEIEGVDETWSAERFQKEKGVKFFEYINDYNNEIIGVDYDSFTKEYGTEYYNSKTKKALKTLEQFIHNMLTPIWVRDCPYNIKGRMSDEQALDFERYRDNIVIKLENKKL